MIAEEKILSDHGIRPTANRIMILREISGSTGPVSMMDLETTLGSVDKSIISRTLGLFREHHLVHLVEDGGDSVRYELCSSHGDSQEDEDAHVHFHCEVCGRTFCFEEVAVPPVGYPSGFEVHYVNYMAKGVCPECKNK